MKRLIPFAGLLLLGLTGCPVKYNLVLAWTSDGNPNIPACLLAPTVRPCKLNQVVHDANGAVVASVPIGTLSYTQTLTAAPTAYYSLVVTALDESGNMQASQPAIAKTVLK